MISNAYNARDILKSKSCTQAMVQVCATDSKKGVVRSAREALLFWSKSPIIREEVNDVSSRFNDTPGGTQGAANRI